VKLRLTAIFTAAVLALSFSDAAAAGPLEDGVAAAQHGRYAKALKLLRPLALKGEPIAQYNLGVMYFAGESVPQDYGVAGLWFRKAAEQGQSAAQFNLGMMCYQGLGVPQDYAQAATWLGKAADQGDPDAQSKLAMLYAYGQGVPQDLIRAHMWYNLAASRYSAADAEKRDGAILARDTIAGQMSVPQVNEAQRLAAGWAASRPPK
jgi:hypothetical protein